MMGEAWRALGPTEERERRGTNPGGMGVASSVTASPGAQGVLPPKELVLQCKTDLSQ